MTKKEKTCLGFWKYLKDATDENFHTVDIGDIFQAVPLSKHKEIIEKKEKEYKHSLYNETKTRRDCYSKESVDRQIKVSIENTIPKETIKKVLDYFEKEAELGIKSVELEHYRGIFKGHVDIIKRIKKQLLGEK